MDSAIFFTWLGFWHKGSVSFPSPYSWNPSSPTLLPPKARLIFAIVHFVRPKKNVAISSLFSPTSTIHTPSSSLLLAAQSSSHLWLSLVALAPIKGHPRWADTLFLRLIFSPLCFFPKSEKRHFSSYCFSQMERFSFHLFLLAKPNI